MAKNIKIFTAAVLFAAASAGQAAARPASELEKKELVLLVQNVDAAAQRRDASLIANTMPERLYREMAARMNVSAQTLRAQLQKSVEAQFSQMAAGGYQLDSKAIRYGEAKNGAFYALVPTRIETKNAIMAFMTLALYDNTKWHLIYGGQKTIQNPVFAEIYPDLAEIAVPAAKITAKAAK